MKSCLHCFSPPIRQSQPFLMSDFDVAVSAFYSSFDDLLFLFLLSLGFSGLHRLGEITNPDCTSLKNPRKISNIFLSPSPTLRLILNAIFLIAKWIKASSARKISSNQSSIIQPVPSTIYLTIPPFVILPFHPTPLFLSLSKALSLLTPGSFNNFDPYSIHPRLVTPLDQVVRLILPIEALLLISSKRPAVGPWML